MAYEKPNLDGKAALFSGPYIGFEEVGLPHKMLILVCGQRNLENHETSQNCSQHVMCKQEDL